MVKEIEKKLIEIENRIPRLDALIALISIHPDFTEETRKIGVKIIEKERENLINSACNLAYVLEAEKEK